MAPRGLIILSLVLALCSVASAQTVLLTTPTPRVTNAQTFNPIGTTAAQKTNYYCGTGTAATYQSATSTLFSGSPSNYINTRFSSVPTGANARIIISLLTYSNSATNVSAPVWSLASAVEVANDLAVLTTGTLKYTNRLTLTDANLCGSSTSSRCVLRWVYNNSASNPTVSYVTCADVIVVSRSEIPLAVHVAPASTESPIQSATALTRVLTSSWATAGSRKIDIFTDLTDPDLVAQLSQQIRMADTPITVISSTSYILHYLLSATSSLTVTELAISLQGQDLSTMLGVTVTAANLKASGSHLTASALVTLAATLLAMLMQRTA